MMIPAKPCSYERFPESEAFAAGMTVLPADFSARSCHIHRGVPYAVKERTLHLEIIEPEQSREGESFPLLIYVQGSAWGEQQIGQELPQLCRFAARGYVIAVVQYRPSAQAPFPAQIRDTKDAARYLIANASAYHADAGRMAVWGDSSGGHTALMSAFTWGLPAFDEKAGSPPLKFRAVVDFYGPTDISRMNEEPSTQDHIGADSPEGMLIGGANVLAHPEKAELTVPMRYVQKERELPPVLIVHGSRDRLVPFGQSVMLYECLKKAGKAVEAYQLKGADHGGAPFWSEKVLDLVDGFLQRHLM